MYSAWHVISTQVPATTATSKQQAGNAPSCTEPRPRIGHWTGSCAAELSSSPHNSSKQASQQPKATQGHTARRQPSWNMPPGRGDSTRLPWAAWLTALSPLFNCLGSGVGNTNPTAVTGAMLQQAHPARPTSPGCTLQVLLQSSSAQRAEPSAGPPARITVFPRAGGNCSHQPRLTGCLLSKLLL